MKIARHAQIIKLINQYDIETQEELAKKLEESGFCLTCLPQSWVRIS